MSSRNYATIVYPESAPVDFRSKLEELHLKAFISPLHDRDLTESGELKKEHFHVLLMFDGKKSQKQVGELVSSFGGVGAETVQNLKSYARYLCHLDETSITKAHYNTDDVICLGGADYAQYLQTTTDTKNYIREMLAYIKERGIVNFCDLLDYASEKRDDWFQSLIDGNNKIIVDYIKSYAFKHGNRERSI